MCRGFQALGCESRAVMPGEPQPGDEADLIRCKFEHLESAEWWRGHRLDGVVLYAWGSPKYRKVAKAIRQAGIFLVLNQDNGGLVSPLAGFAPWLREQWILAGRGRGGLACLRFLKLTLRGLGIGLFLTDPRRASHLRNGNLIACVSPLAAEHYRKLCRIYGGENLARRVVVIPHAVESRFSYQGSKQRRVVCVGRWQDTVQKRPWLMMDVAGLLAAADERIEIDIVGNTTPELLTWHHSLPQSQRDRVRIRGLVGRGELADLLQDSQIFYSPSAFESYGIAAAEALCSGCSVVAGRSVSMASFEWFVSEDSGTLAITDDAAGHLLALQQELDRWGRVDRDPGQISRIWRERLHAGQVAAKAIELAKDPRFSN